jgi:ABC-type transport system involved in multi-copper enzyme maturation permease subunit
MYFILFLVLGKPRVVEKEIKNFLSKVDDLQSVLYICLCSMIYLFIYLFSSYGKKGLNPIVVPINIFNCVAILFPFSNQSISKYIGHIFHQMQLEFNKKNLILRFFYSCNHVKQKIKMCTQYLSHDYKYYKYLSNTMLLYCMLYTSLNWSIMNDFKTFANVVHQTPNFSNKNGS